MGIDIDKGKWEDRFGGYLLEFRRRRDKKRKISPLHVLGVLVTSVRRQAMCNVVFIAIYQWE